MLVGAGGVGKSHLLEAIRRGGEGPERGGRVELVGIETLAEWLGAAGGPPSDAVRGRLLGADLLLLDDFDAVSRHPQLQGLLQEVLEARQAVEREVVIASARPPGELAHYALLCREVTIRSPEPSVGRSGVFAGRRRGGP